MKSLKRNFHVVLICAVLLSAFMASPASATIVKKSGVVMGTELEVTFNVTDTASIDPAFAAVVAEMTRIEEMMSEWKETSPVSLINRNAGKGPVAVPDELFKVIFAAQLTSEVTKGAFDISWAALRGLWDFAPGHERIPTDAELKKAVALINFNKVVLDPGKKTVFLKDAGMSIGLGGIAKGYAVDKAMETLNRLGIKNAIVKAGGDMRVQGVSDTGPWEIGIKNPRLKDAFIAKLRLTDISISTSGDYERFFIKDGVLYHHIIDVRTGQPARESRSVTILARDTMTTDAFSTAIFVLGPVEGMRLVERLNGIEAIIVDANGKVRASSGINIGETAAPKAQ
ncbi:MAG: FAD:protein FMN transferase [Deltaproteobacteria bacterium]|nr:FAD:protein FMN transferase [Deltaproteobacteria bacterium]